MIVSGQRHGARSASVLMLAEPAPLGLARFLADLVEERSS